MAYASRISQIITKRMLFENTAELTERGVGCLYEAFDDTTFIQPRTHSSQRRRYILLGTRQKIMYSYSILALTESLTNVSPVKKGVKVWIVLGNCHHFRYTKRSGTLF